MGATLVKWQMGPLAGRVYEPILEAILLDPKLRFGNGGTCLLFSVLWFFCNLAAGVLL
jgi:hypothetical protein